MLLVRRLLTALLLLATIFTVVYVIGLGLGEHLATERAVAELPTNLRAVDHDRAIAWQAKEEFDRQYQPIIGLGALAVAAGLSMWLTFGGVLSWCQEGRLPPLPDNLRYGASTYPPRRKR